MGCCPWTNGEPYHRRCDAASAATSSHLLYIFLLKDVAVLCQSLRKGGVKKMRTSTMVHASILIAISIVLTRFASFMLTPYIRLGFGPIPIYLGGILFGPWVGAMIGGLADLIGFWFNTFGAALPNPFIALASVCRGLLPPLFLKILGAKQPSFKALLITIALTEIVAGLGLTTYGLTTIYHLPFSVLIVPRLVSTSILVLINSLILYPISTKLLANKVLHKEASSN